MKSRRYSAALATGCCAAGGTLRALLPDFASQAAFEIARMFGRTLCRNLTSDQNRPHRGIALASTGARLLLELPILSEAPVLSKAVAGAPLRKRLKSCRSATNPLEADWHWQIVVCGNRNKMQIAPEITFEGSDPSPAARDLILSEIERLETHNQRITGCRVTVIAPSHKHRHGIGFQVHIWLTIPSHENIVVNHTATNDARNEHAQVAIKDAFAAARRQVDDLARQRGATDSSR
jgi:ribosome-associated translation inhibitor RaiA